MALSGLVTLTLDLLTSSWDHGSPESWASFLPIFSFLCLSVLELGSGTRQTDGQRDYGHQRLMPPPMGRGIISYKCFVVFDAILKLSNERFKMSAVLT